MVISRVLDFLSTWETSILSITELQDSNEQTAAALKTAEHRLFDLALLIKHTTTYKELKPLYSEYKKSRDKEKYLRGREREIILFEASARALKTAGVGDKLPDLVKLREEYSRLSEVKDRLYAEYGSPKKTCAGIGCRQAEHRQHPIPQSWAGTGQSLVAFLTFTHYFQTI